MALNLSRAGLSLQTLSPTTEMGAAKSDLLYGQATGIGRDQEYKTTNPDIFPNF
jgi:hypothetical protein